MQFGYTLLYVDDVEKALAFYAKAFGLEIGFLHESLQYGELMTGPTKLGFVAHQTAAHHGLDYTKLSPKSKPPGCEIAFVTKKVEEAYQHAINSGATPVSKPEIKPWGQVVSYVKDYNGFLIEICSPMS